MRSKKNVRKIIPFITDRLSDIHKDGKAHILAIRPKMYAQNPCCAYIFCSIIIETRPQRTLPNIHKVKSLKILERMTNIVIIFVGEAVFLLQKIIHELSIIVDLIVIDCLKFILSRSMPNTHV